MSETSETLPLSEWVLLRWWTLHNWFRRCPECSRRGYSGLGPRWEDDKIAQMLGVAQYGCPRCGKGATAERDRANGADA